MSRSLTLDLQGTFRSLLANMKDLPLSLKDKLFQTCHHMSELHARFATARSFADLQGSILRKSLAIMTQAQQSMDEVMEYVFQNPMGLFADTEPLAPATTATPLPQDGDILKIQAAYDPKGCDDNTK